MNIKELDKTLLMEFNHITSCIENFDKEFYLSEYPDVNIDSALSHFIEYGFYEGRKPYENYVHPTFDFSRQSIEEFTNLPIKIYVPTFDNPTYLNNFMDQIINIEWLTPVIYDNNSVSYKMLKTLQHYENKGITILRSPKNLGPESIYTDSKNFKGLPDFCLISDPDLELKETLNLENVRDLIAISEMFKIGKVGHALNISENKHTTKKIIHGTTLTTTFQWEQQFWQNKVGKMINGDELYSAPIGATFCLLNKTYLNINNHWSRGIRIAGERTIVHIPWENPKFVPYFERKNYQRRQKHSFYTIPVLRVRLLKFTKLLLGIIKRLRRR